jgi:hypothetical protein
MNSGLMLCIEPDWIDTLYDMHFEEFDVFEGLSEQFMIVLHQMFTGMIISIDSFISMYYLDIRHFNIRSIKPAMFDTTSKHNARSTGREKNSSFEMIFLFDFQHSRYAIDWYKCVGVHCWVP